MIFLTTLSFKILVLKNSLIHINPWNEVWYYDEDYAPTSENSLKMLAEGGLLLFKPMRNLLDYRNNP